MGELGRYGLRVLRFLAVLRLMASSFLGIATKFEQCSRELSRCSSSRMSMRVARWASGVGVVPSSLVLMLQLVFFLRLSAITSQFYEWRFASGFQFGSLASAIADFTVRPHTRSLPFARGAWLRARCGRRLCASLLCSRGILHHRMPVASLGGVHPR